MSGSGLDLNRKIATKALVILMVFLVLAAAHNNTDNHRKTSRDNPPRITVAGFLRWGWYALFLALCFLSIMCHLLTVFVVDQWKTVYLVRSVGETVQNLALLDDVVNREGILNVYEKMYSLDEQYRYGLFLKCTLFSSSSQRPPHKLCTQNKVITISRKQSRRLLFRGDRKRVMDDVSNHPGSSNLPSTCAFSTDCSFDQRLSNQGPVRWHRTQPPGDEQSAFVCNCEYMPYTRKIFKLSLLVLLTLTLTLATAIANCFRPEFGWPPKKRLLLLSNGLVSSTNLFYFLIIAYHWRNRRAEVTHLLDSVFKIRQSRHYPKADLTMISRANAALADSMVVKAGPSFVLELVAAAAALTASVLCLAALAFHSQLNAASSEPSSINSSEDLSYQERSGEIRQDSVELDQRRTNQIYSAAAIPPPPPLPSKTVRVGKYFEQSLKDGTFSTV